MVTIGTTGLDRGLHAGGGWSRRQEAYTEAQQETNTVEQKNWMQHDAARTACILRIRFSILEGWVYFNLSVLGSQNKSPLKLCRRWMQMR